MLSRLPTLCWIIARKSSYDATGYGITRHEGERMSMASITDLTVSHVIDVVVQLLAEERQEAEADTRAWLEEAGREMPIDSLLIVEILARVEDEFGVRIPADADAARSMRSVRMFAETVVATGQGGGDDGIEG
jgi:acyl carrier protein